MNKHNLQFSALLLATICSLLLSAAPLQAVTVNITYLDGAGFGFNDATLGASRKTAFEFAVNQWSSTFDGTQTVQIEALFDSSLQGNDFGAVLGVCGFKNTFANFTNAPQTNTWYPVPLANQYFGGDLDGADRDIRVRFNPRVDVAAAAPTGHLLGVDFYYGTDGLTPAAKIDFVTVALHELGHGFGNASVLNVANGTSPLGLDDIYTKLSREGASGNFTGYSDLQTSQAMVSNNVFFFGSNVTTANSGAGKLYCPAPKIVSGSTFSHWDSTGQPGQLMNPSIPTAASNHSLGLTQQLMVDIGWTVSTPPPPPPVLPSVETGVTIPWNIDTR